MEEDFIYWRHPTIPGIKVEEVSGGDRYTGATWQQMALQVYCENGREAYREIGHYKNGAPFLHGKQTRISITHCRGLLAVATLPATPEVDLGSFSERASLGIDAEIKERAQVLRIRDKFLSPEEAKDIAPDDVALNIQAWTLKEAAYKAVLGEKIDFKEEIRILKIPRLAPATTHFNPADFGLETDNEKLPEEFFGEVMVDTGVERVRLRAYSYESEGAIVTLCYSPKCAKHGSNHAS